MDHNSISILVWALDLVRAIQDFSPIRKWLLKLVLGKYAYRELVGLRDALEADGLNTRIGYDLENCNYHKEKVRL